MQQPASGILSVGPLGDTTHLTLVDAHGRDVVTVLVRVDLAEPEDIEELRATLARIDARIRAVERTALKASLKVV